MPIKKKKLLLKKKKIPLKKKKLLLKKKKVSAKKKPIIKKVVTVVQTKIKMQEVLVEILPDGRMTLSNAAKYLGLMPNTLYQRDKKDWPKSIKIRGKVFFYKKDLDYWIASHYK